MSDIAARKARAVLEWATDFPTPVSVPDATYLVETGVPGGMAEDISADVEDFNRAVEDSGKAITELRSHEESSDAELSDVWKRVGSQLPPLEGFLLSGGLTVHDVLFTDPGDYTDEVLDEECEGYEIVRDLWDTISERDDLSRQLAEVVFAVE